MPPNRSLGVLTLTVHNRAAWITLEALDQFPLAPADIPIAQAVQRIFLTRATDLRAAVRGYRYIVNQVLAALANFEINVVQSQFGHSQSELVTSRESRLADAQGPTEN